MKPAQIVRTPRPEKKETSEWTPRMQGLEVGKGRVLYKQALKKVYTTNERQEVLHARPPITETL
jgi:hypothetical protein